MPTEIYTIAIPATITFLAFFWTWIIVGWNDTGILSGLGDIIATLPASIISLVAWIAYIILN
jgi:hypothetical protein